MRIIHRYKYRLAKKRIENDMFFKNKFIERLLGNVFRHGFNLREYSDDQLEYSYRICCMLSRVNYVYYSSFVFTRMVRNEKERRAFTRNNVINFKSYANDGKR
jgi:hypothetical protein